MSIPYTFEEIDNISESLAMRSLRDQREPNSKPETKQDTTSYRSESDSKSVGAITSVAKIEEPIPVQQTKLEGAKSTTPQTESITPQAENIKKLLDDMIPSSESKRKVAEVPVGHNKKEQVNTQQNIEPQSQERSVAGFKVVNRCRDNSAVITTNKSATRYNSTYIGIAAGIAGVLAMLL
jgi:hypothetical protein